MNRRGFLTAATAFLASPALVRASSLDYVPRAINIESDEYHIFVGGLRPNASYTFEMIVTDGHGTLHWSASEKLQSFQLNFVGSVHARHTQSMLNSSSFEARRQHRFRFGGG